MTLPRLLLALSIHEESQLAPIFSNDTSRGVIILFLNWKQLALILTAEREGSVTVDSNTEQLLPGRKEKKNQQVLFF